MNALEQTALSSGFRNRNASGLRSGLYFIIGRGWNWRNKPGYPEKAMNLQALGAIGWQEVAIILFFALLAGVFVLVIRQNALDLQEIKALLAEEDDEDSARVPVGQRHGKD